MNLLRNTYLLGHIPLPRDFDNELSKHRLEVEVTNDGNLRLGYTLPPKSMFDNYSYRSELVAPEHIEKRMRVAEKAFGQLNKKSPSRICEVGCNDGYMLNQYADCGLSNLVGIDPAKNLHQYIDDKVKVYGDYLTYKSARNILEEQKKFDLVFAANCVAHTPTPVSMLEGIRELMRSDGLAIVQFQYMVDMLKKTQFYNIYHEHYYYFSVIGFTALAARAGLNVLSTEHVPEQDGSILCVLSKKLSRNALGPIAEQEEEYFSYFDRVFDFMSRTNVRLNNLVAYVNAQPRHSINGIFFSAKAMVMLNLAVDRGLQLDRFEAFYDDNAQLWGKCVPGTEIPIKALHPIEKASGQGILFSPNLEDVARHRLPDVEITNIEEIMNG